jgi:hypothetical protein
MNSINSSNSVRYRIVETNSIESITNWVFDHEGSDIEINGFDRTIWAVVPYHDLDEFLFLYGSQVSAI